MSVLDGLSFLMFLVSVVLLLYSLGPRDLEAEVEAFVDASERHDDESASWHAGALLLGQAPDNARRLHRSIVENILVEANERVLAIIFWFVILGPAGAILYRLVCQLKGHNGAQEDAAFAQAVKRLHFILAWLPVRLCALAYALGGSFVDAMHGWRNEVADPEDESRNVLIASGLGALRMAPVDELEAPDRDTLLDEVKEAMALVRRAVMVYLAILAVLILAGWTF
jgi:membrane protein required for beta-lactamase induction